MNKVPHPTAGDPAETIEPEPSYLDSWRLAHALQALKRPRGFKAQLRREHAAREQAKRAELEGGCAVGVEPTSTLQHRPTADAPHASAGDAQKTPRPKGALAKARLDAAEARQEAATAAKRIEKLTSEVQALQARAASAAADAEQPVDALHGLRTIGPAELGLLLGRSTAMIRVDSSRRPETLPPRFMVPGMRKMLWRVVDVKEWMDALVEVEHVRREAKAKFAHEFGLTLGRNDAAFATTRVYAKRAASKQRLKARGKP